LITLAPVTLEGHGVRLEPLAAQHANDLRAAASDGKLWELWYTFVPEPNEVEAYIERALAGQKAGTMLPWVVCMLPRSPSGREAGVGGFSNDKAGRIVGTTRYHDIIIEADRVEIGYTWYAQSWQRTHVNTACKLLLFTHAFETLGCGVVGLRTDNFNFRSQRAIEALGAKKDGVIRHNAVRRDGSVRDTVMYSVLATEWEDVKRHLQCRLIRATITHREDPT
jgi:RimJ/RimL family protein N-acetyltransferase